MTFRSGFTNAGELAGLLNANYLKPTIRVSPSKNIRRGLILDQSLNGVGETHLLLTAI